MAAQKMIIMSMSRLRRRGAAQRSAAQRSFPPPCERMPPTRRPQARRGGHEPPDVHDIMQSRTSVQAHTRTYALARLASGTPVVAH